jgi:ABC-type amino acid transport substrate-binding protein
MAAVLALSLAACGGNGNNPGSTASKGGESNTGNKADLNLVKEGTLIMGTNAEFPPFEFKEGDGFVGIDVELMEAIATKLGLDFQVEDMAFESLTESFGKIDVIAAGFTIKPDREITCDFTNTYFNATQTVIVSADSTIATVEDLDNKKIGVQNGTTGYDTAKELTDEANITQYNNGSLAVEALVGGKIDAVIIDKNPANAYKDQHGDKIKLVEGLFDTEEYALAVKKGNKELLDALNKALDELKADGTFDKIVEKYIPSK